MYSTALRVERRQHVHRLESRRRRAFAEPLLLGRGRFGEMVVFDEGKRRHVQRRADAEVIIEAARRRAVADRRSPDASCEMSMPRCHLPMQAVA